MLLLVVAAGLVLLRPSVHGNDGVQNYAYLRSLMFDGNLDFSNEYHHYMALDSGWFDDQEIARNPRTGLPINLYGVGCSLLWAPWVVAADRIGALANLCGANVLLDGYSHLYEIGVGVGSCVYASAGLMILFILLRRSFSDNEALWAVLLVWLASPLFFYMYFHPSMSHANSFFLASLFLYLYFSGDERWRWTALGAVLGLMALTRYQDAVLVVCLVPGELMRRRTGDGFALGPRLSRYFLLGGTGLLCFVPQLLAWWALQGSPWSGPQAYLTQGADEPIRAGAHAGRAVRSTARPLLLASSVAAGTSWPAAGRSVPARAGCLHYCVCSAGLGRVVVEPLVGWGQLWTPNVHQFLAVSFLWRGIDGPSLRIASVVRGNPGSRRCSHSVELRLRRPIRSRHDSASGRRPADDACLQQSCSCAGALAASGLSCRSRHGAHRCDPPPPLPSIRGRMFPYIDCPGVRHRLKAVFPKGLHSHCGEAIESGYDPRTDA